ncbi:MAG: M2 family metallopeptidase, partial [Planctomycetes bacterium]|nr:M2 family metallopeptidase [Planctomycetota bacterium]
QAALFTGLDGLDYDTSRKLNIFRSGIVIPAPRDAAKIAEQAEIGAKMSGLYGKGSYCRAQGACLALDDLEEIMAHSRNPDELLEVWEGWRTISPPMKDLYARQVELANQGAVELGFDDLGVMWRSAYDMDRCGSGLPAMANEHQCRSVEAFLKEEQEILV